VPIAVAAVVVGTTPGPHRGGDAKLLPGRSFVARSHRLGEHPNLWDEVLVVVLKRKIKFENAL